MRKIIFITVCAIAIVSCNKSAELSGNETKNEFNILKSSFSGIAIQDGFELHLKNETEAETESNIKIFADEQIISSVKHEIRNGIMYFFKDPDTEFPDNALIKIEISRDSVNIIKSLNSKIYIADTLKTDSLTVNCSNSTLAGIIECQQFDAKINNSSISLAGNAVNTVMDVSGGSTVGILSYNSQNLWNGIKTVNARLYISGGSIVNMSIENELEIYARENSILNYATAGVLRSVILDDDSKMILQKIN